MAAANDAPSTAMTPRGPDVGEAAGQYLPEGPLPITVSKDGFAVFSRDAFLGGFPPGVRRMQATRMKAVTQDVGASRVSHVSHPDVVPG